MSTGPSSFCLAFPLKTMLYASSVSDLVEWYLHTDILYGLCFQNLLVLFICCNIIEQKFKGGITLYVYVHIFRFNII